MTPFDWPPEGAKTDCGICNLKSKCIEQFRIKHYDRPIITEEPIPSRRIPIIDADAIQKERMAVLVHDEVHRFSLRRGR